MSTKQVADKLGVSAQTVRRLATNGDLKIRPVSPVLQRAKAFEFDADIVEAYLKKLHSASK